MKQQITKTNTVKKVSTLAVMGMIGLHSVPSYAAQTMVYGTVKAAQPIAHANLRVIQNGKVIAQQKGATDENGNFKISVLTNNPSTLTIEASGADNFDGTLYGSVDTRDQLNVAVLNPATTLSTLVKQMTRVSQQDADLRVKNYLQLPNTMSLGSGTQDTSPAVYSVVKLLNEAKRVGGFNNYTMGLALQMTYDPTATHAMKMRNPNNLQNPAFWAIEKLLAGVAGKIGADLFSGFMNGMGMPSKDDQMLVLLNTVLKRLDEIQAQLNKIEIRVIKGDYNNRTATLVNEYSDYIAILDRMKKTDIVAKANIGKDGKIISTDVQNQIISAGKTYIAEMTALGTKFLTHAHAQLMPNSMSMDPLQKVFGEFTYLEAPIITTKYFAQLDEHLDRFKILQAVTAVLVADAQKVSNPVIGQATAEMAQDYIKAQGRIYPDYPLFTSKDIAQVSSGQYYYDKATNLVWDTKYSHFYSCQDFKVNQRDGSNPFRAANYDQTLGMMNRLNALNGTSGAVYTEVMKSVGFSQGDLDVKMIVHGCDFNGFWWFGNDQRGVADQYYDKAYNFDQVKKSKGMGNGFYGMRARDLIL